MKKGLKYTVAAFKDIKESLKNDAPLTTEYSEAVHQAYVAGQQKKDALTNAIEAHKSLEGPSKVCDTVQASKKENKSVTVESTVDLGDTLNSLANALGKDTRNSELAKELAHCFTELAACSEMSHDLMMVNVLPHLNNFLDTYWDDAMKSKISMEQARSQFDKERNATFMNPSKVGKAEVELRKASMRFWSSMEAFQQGTPQLNQVLLFTVKSLITNNEKCIKCCDEFMDKYEKIVSVKTNDS